MKFIKVLSVQVPPGFGFGLGVQSGCVAQDGTTTTLNWLQGSNQWGLHNDPRFGESMATIRQSMRIMEAAERAKAVGDEYIELLPEDFALLLSITRAPMYHPNSPPCPVDLKRAIIPILEGIEKALDARPEDKKD